VNQVAALTGPEGASVDGAGPPESAAMSVCRVGGRTRTPVTACVGSHLEVHRTDSGGLVALVHLSSDMDLHSSLGGCYSASAAPGGGACRKARDGACVRHAEEHTVNGRSHGFQDSGPHDSMQGVERRNVEGICQDDNGSQATTKCKQSKCDVSIGDTTYCSQCSMDNEYLINGECKATDSESICVSPTGGVCTSCKEGYFLHKGGCYKIATPPGSTICKTAGAAGICEVCQAGYFKNPASTSDATKQSCIACGDTTGADSNIGVANCAECTAPATSGSGGTAKCTKCTGPNYLMTATDGSTSCVTECPTGYFGHTATSGGLKTCQSCSGENAGLTPAGAGIAGCAACTYDSAKVTCTKCETGKYLRTTSDSTSCVEASGCGSGFFPKADDKAGNKCAACSTASDGGIENCTECSLLPSASRSSATLIICTKCSNNNLSPLKNECMASCPAGTYAKDKVCTPCHASCSECADDAESSCTACYPGSVLNHGSTAGKGMCIPECTGRYAENCGAGMCKAELGGSKYCSKCTAGYAPIDGVCTQVATTSRDASGCTASGGVCTTCTGDYALLSGGCYNTQALPGSAVCTAANGGQCTACANGQTPDSSGVCPACPAGCSKCSSSSICTDCLAGYYLSSSKSVKCSENSTNGSNTITGVKDCVSCKEPSSGPGPVTCYVTQTPTVDPTDPSVNKGGLSSGAIAGISVAAVVVVGGLVGFLCWWFICRGKA
ncbi:Variant-specific surface protein, partial [Giardia duodenalis]